MSVHWEANAEVKRTSQQSMTKTEPPAIQMARERLVPEAGAQELVAGVDHAPLLLQHLHPPRCNLEANVHLARPILYASPCISRSSRAIHLLTTALESIFEAATGADTHVPDIELESARSDCETRLGGRPLNAACAKPDPNRCAGRLVWGSRPPDWPSANVMEGP